MVQCHKEAQGNAKKKGMEQFNISKKCMRFHIILSIVVALILMFTYYGILQMETRFRVPLLLFHGILVALILGHLWAKTFLELIRKHVYQKTQEREETVDDVYIDTLAIPAWVVGITERVFLGALVAFNIPGTGAAMGTWMLVKTGTDWHRLLSSAEKPSSTEGSKQEKTKHKIGPRSLAWCSLSAGVVSLFFALIGGLICRTALDP
jgi:hypothetical protein